MSNLNKAERQNQLIHVIQQNRKMTASELATALNVSKRTISRDIAELEEQGVRIFAQHGKWAVFKFNSLNQNGTFHLRRATTCTFSYTK